MKLKYYNKTRDYGQREDGIGDLDILAAKHKDRNL